MTTNAPTTSEPASPRRPAVRTLATLRMFAGGSTWANPARAWKLFGLGPMTSSDGSSTVSRLFGVRDVALALAVLHPRPEVSRLALQAGVVIDTADVASTLLGVRAGAPKTSLLGVAAGAGLFVGLGLIGLKQR